MAKILRSTEKNEAQALVTNADSKKGSQHRFFEYPASSWRTRFCMNVDCTCLHTLSANWGITVLSRYDAHLWATASYSRARWGPAEWPKWRPKKSQNQHDFPRKRTHPHSLTSSDSCKHSHQRRSNFIIIIPASLVKPDRASEIMGSGNRCTSCACKSRNKLCRPRRLESCRRRVWRREKVAEKEKEGGEEEECKEEEEREEKE